MRVPSTDVLEVVPVQLLFEDSFYQYLALNNERMAKLQANTLIQLEKYFIDHQVILSFLLCNY